MPTYSHMYIHDPRIGTYVHTWRHLALVSRMCDSRSHSQGLASLALRGGAAPSPAPLPQLYHHTPRHKSGHMEDCAPPHVSMVRQMRTYQRTTRRTYMETWLETR